MLYLAGKLYGEGSTLLQQLKVLLGRMARVVMVVLAGRRFMNRLLLLLQGPQRPGSTVVILSSGALEDLSWWLIYGRKLNNRVLFSTSRPCERALFVVDGRGRSNDGPPSIGGLCHELMKFFSVEVPQDLYDAPVHIIEAAALLVACRLWVHYLGHHGAITVGSDNVAVVESVRHGKPRDSQLGSMVRLLWGLFAEVGADCFCVYVPSSQNTSDGVSRCNKMDVDFLLSQGWTQDHPDPILFSFKESDPFLCQEGT